MIITCGGCKSPKNKKQNKLDIDAITNSPIEIDDMPEEIFVDEFDANEMLCKQCKSQDVSCYE